MTWIYVAPQLITHVQNIVLFQLTVSVLTLVSYFKPAFDHSWVFFDCSLFSNISVSSTTSGYGIQLDGNCPVVLCNILRGSVAERAGVKAGDYLIAFNGNDTQESTEDNVGSMLQNSYGSALELRVARPHPLPVSSIDKRRALLTLQNKVIGKLVVMS